MSDYHVHLHDHGVYAGIGPPHGEYPPGHIEAYIEAAARRGVDEVGFTEHLYRCVEAAPVLGDFWADEPHHDLAEDTRKMFRDDLSLSLNGYVEAVLAAKDRGLPVKLGLEVDFFPNTIEAVMDLLEPYPWDFLIGAVHWVGGWSVDYGVSAYEFDRRGIRRAYEDYFAIETELAASGQVDVLAHVDVVKRFGHVPDDTPIDLYQQVVDAAAASGTAVELSSAGLHKPVGEVYPSPTFLSMFYKAGVPITLASDAHQPDECGRDHEKLVALARATGYDHYLTFDRRHPILRSLP
ncbi:MAG: histidinol-phosphatase HisJ family protein [Acidimicrobiia bacterium]|nr:histidinol-phosphatase HisJ family protein [Acidimicrobiia bacterium]